MNNIGATVYIPTSAMQKQQQQKINDQTYEKTTTSNNTMTANNEHSSSRVVGESNNYQKAFLSTKNNNNFNCNNKSSNKIYSKSAVTETLCSNDNNSHVVTIQISQNASKLKHNQVLTDQNQSALAQCQTSKVSIVSFGPPENNFQHSSVNTPKSPQPANELQSVTSIETTNAINQDQDQQQQYNDNENQVKTVFATTPTSIFDKTVLDTKKSMLEMGQKPTPTTASELEVNNATYLYYMMTSGQCSPSETLDSGTCSDIELTPPPLPKKNSPKLKITTSNANVSNNNTMTKQSEMMSKNLSENQKIDNNLSINSNERKNSLSTCHNRNRSFTDDSDASESSSSLSCDSISFTDLNGTACRRSSPSSLNSISNTNSTSVSNEEDNNSDDDKEMRSTVERRQQQPAADTKVNFLPDSLLKDIRARSKIINLSEVKLKKYSAPISVDPIVVGPITDQMITKNLSKVYLNQCNNNNQNHKSLNSSINMSNGWKTSLNNIGFGEFNSKTIRKSDKQYYENDKFYKFHINEHVIDEVDPDVRAVIDDESYVGYKEIESGNSTIKSSKGTVRGVKNRVRNGIATFLQMTQTHPNKNYKEKDGGKVVVYTTSMGIVRNTYTQCATIKQILKTLLIKFEERDVFMSGEYQQEVKDRMQCNDIIVPQLFVDGKHIGDAECVERLNETGELRKMLKPYKCLESSFTCQTCGGYRLLPCSSCGGSKKSIHRNHFTTEFVALKCMNCDEVGLVKCHNC